MMKLLRELADNREAGSLATKWRQRRFAFFESLISSLTVPITVLDIGGTEVYWKHMGFTEKKRMSVVLLNLTKTKTDTPRVTSVAGDARNLKEFQDNEFDVVFSNSVIEHMGDYDQQRQMAAEVMRVGKRYFLQTPNRFFPIEPHFLFPFFQFLPLFLRAWLVRNFDLGFYAEGRIPDKRKAIETVSSIRLLSRRELEQLFPGGNIFRERLLGLTKSFVVYGGWQEKPQSSVTIAVFRRLSSGLCALHVGRKWTLLNGQR